MISLVVLWCDFKLYVCDPDEFNKFLEDYDAAVALQGKLKDINIWFVCFGELWIFINKDFYSLM